MKKDNMVEYRWKIKYHLLERKATHNLKKTIVDSSVTSHHDDTTPTFLKVDQFRKKLYDPVLMYKQLNIDDPTKGLKKDEAAAGHV